jgi:predicted acyltransferase (DUF342 family)
VAGYFALLILFFLLFGMSFYFGVREWRHPRDDAPLPVDVEYVRVENYFGVSFRSKIREWLQTASPVLPPEQCQPPVRAVLEKPNGERIVVLAGGSFGGPEERQEVVYSDGDLSIPAMSTFNREVYAAGNLETGPDVKLQAVAADGELVLGDHNEVARWVDARRKVWLRRGTVVHSRVSSAVAIAVEPEVSAQSLYAPFITTAGYHPREAAATVPAGSGGNGAGEDTVEALKTKSATQLSSDTTLVDGDLDLPPDTHIHGNLVVRGTLQTKSDCWFDGSVNALAIELGARNRVAGNLVSGGMLRIGECSAVRQNVMAQMDVVLNPGVTIGEPPQPAVVTAGRDIRLERDVLIHGKAAAGRAIITA